MKTFHATFTVETSGFCDVVDITPFVEDNLKKSGIHNGIVLVFVPGSTAGITTIEYEPGLRRDLPELMEKLVPSNKPYHHDQTWHDGNGFSHLRSSLIGPSLTLPVINGRIVHGTWQQVVLVDFDNRPRRREVVLQFLGS